MRKLVGKFLMTAATISILFANVNTAKATDLTTDDISMWKQETNVLARTSGTYTFGQSKSSYTIGMMAINSSSHFKIIMPDNYNNSALLQGNVYFIPLTNGGTSINYMYGNFALREYELDLSQLSDGIYMVKIDGEVLGTAAYVNVRVDY